MGWLDRLKKALKKQGSKTVVKPKAETETAVIRPRVAAKIRPLDLLSKLEKLDQLDVKADHIKTRTDLILEAIARHDQDVETNFNRVGFVLGQHDRKVLEKLDNLKLDDALRPRVHRALEEIKLTYKLQEILEVFKSREVLSTKEVALIFETARTTASGQLNTLHKKGLIRRIRRGVYCYEESRRDR